MDLRSCPACCARFPGWSILAEPAPLNALLRLDPDRVAEATLVRLVRLLVRALGRRRHGDERQLVLKCTSWNIRRRAVLDAAFPETPWVWVQRDPVQVLASLMAEPPERRPITDAMREAAQRFAEPGYRALASSSGTSTIEPIV